MNTQVEIGRPFPLGATCERGGVNFSVYSRSAVLIELLLFDGPDAAAPSRTIPLDPTIHRTGFYWHVFVPGLGQGQHYGFRTSGPHIPAQGLRFDPSKVLIDPYSYAVAVPKAYDRGAAAKFGEDNTPVAMKSVVVDPSGYDWEGVRPPRRPLARSVIYEVHLKGFTAHPSSGVPAERRGTYAGLIDKIPYLKDLGVTAIELLPVQQFDAQHGPRGLPNYWGYSTVSFFAPHVQYSACNDPVGAVTEFRDMVKALHRAGIEVILDVVYNHTAEGDQTGPMFCYRGFDDAAYYVADPKDRSLYANYTGCGNTVNCNHSSTRRLIVDSLRYWANVMGVDGFRFDLAAIFSRDHKGRVLKDPPVVWDISSHPELAGVKMIAEPWDCAGLNQVGSFGGNVWARWNDHFRDDVRKFVRGDGGAIRGLATRLSGSSDLFERDDGRPAQNINFFTCHDGFPLIDLFTFEKKLNLANREDNRDGNDDNKGWNCGVEGPTDDPNVLALRRRLSKNALAILMMSIGVPMMLGGDEMLRTQQGNNNAYCQDNEISWFDWSLVEKNADMLEFVRRLIRIRQAPRPEELLNLSLGEQLRKAKIRWHGTKLRHADWTDHSRCLSVTITPALRQVVFHAIFNGSEYDLDFELPRPPKAEKCWRRLIDTAQPPGQDATLGADAAEIREGSYRASARSVVLLAGRLVKEA